MDKRRKYKASPPVEELQHLSTQDLCKKYSVSDSTIRRYRKRASLENCGPPDPILAISETDKAYLAGLIDADGHIIIKATRNTAYPGIGVNQTDFQALEWMADLLRGTVAFHTRRRTGSNGFHRKQMIVRLHGRRAQLLCKTILPYLKIKREQAKIVLQFPCDTRSTGLSEDVNQLRFALKSKMHKLNGRGH